METWIIYALLSMLFAGVTSVLAKFGLAGVNADVAMAVRTTVIFGVVLVFIFSTGRVKEISMLNLKHYFLLAASGITAALSWIFYFRAIKDGLVSYVTAIDKASILITILLSFFLLKEPVTPRILVGALLIFSGMIVLVWK